MITEPAARLPGDCRDPASPAAAARTNRLTIVGVDTELGFAGGETQVLGLTHCLIAAGHRAEILCDPRGQLWERARAAGVVCYPLRVRNAFDVKAGLAFRRLLSSHRCDIVHFHTARAHALAPYARGLGARLVVTRRMDYRPNRLFAPYLYNRAVDAVVAISGAVASALQESGVKRNHIEVIPSGIDCDRFRPPSESERIRRRSELGLGADDVAIATVAALEPRKGHRYLLEALAAIAKDGSPPGERLAEAGAKQSPLKCFIAGDGSLKDVLIRHSALSGLGSTVMFMGQVADPCALYHAADMFVLPSLKEGLGVALLEAMACGLPAVGTDSSGIRDSIHDGVNGFLVKPADPIALAKALQTLAASPDLRARMGSQARQRALSGFSIVESARRMLEVYWRVLGHSESETGAV